MNYMEFDFKGTEYVNFTREYKKFLRCEDNCPTGHESYVMGFIFDNCGWIFKTDDERLISTHSRYYFRTVYDLKVDEYENVAAMRDRMISEFIELIKSREFIYIDPRITDGTKMMEQVLYDFDVLINWIPVTFKTYGVIDIDTLGQHGRLETKILMAPATHFARMHHYSRFNNIPKTLTTEYADKFIRINDSDNGILSCPYSDKDIHDVYQITKQYRR